MSSNSLLTDPESIRSNQNGQLTKDQYSSLRGKYSSLPGGVTLVIMAGLLLLAYFLAGKTLAQSTPLALIALVVVILVTFAITAVLGGLLANLRMPKVSIEQVRGQVTWNNNRYSAVAGGRTLEPIADGFNLQPGDYIFYLQRGTKYLLAIQPAAAAGGAASPPMDLNSLKALVDQPLDFDPRLEPDKAAQHMAQLKQAFENLDPASTSGIDRQEAADLVHHMTGQMQSLVQGQSLSDLAQLGRQFEAASRPKLDNSGLIQLTSALDQVGVRNASTLMANQAGKQSLDQRASLLKQVASNLFWSAVVGIAWLVFSYMLITRSDWRGLFVVSAFLALVFIAILSSVRAELFDLIGGSVQIEEGPVSKYSRSSQSGHSSHISYYYRINQYSLSVSAHAYDALIESNYRVYLLPNTKQLVNIDPLPG
jgi:protein-S-isoprenylcysteine O-methyltransferase Ste14